MFYQWKMFLDDERQIKTIYPNAEDNEYILARSYNKAVLEIMCRRSIPSFISFDHDLGVEDNGWTIAPTGFDLAKILVEWDITRKFYFPEDFKFHVHSANPCGAANINGLLNNYLDFKLQQKSE